MAEKKKQILNMADHNFTDFYENDKNYLSKQRMTLI